MAKTRLEFKDKTSQKFWEIDCKGNTITILYGKLGTSGQTSVKTLATPAAAQAERDKAIQSKLKKGYTKK